MKKLVTLGVMLMSVTLLFADIPVTFQANMTVKVEEGVFVPGTDNVTLRGSFMNEMGLSGDWFPDEGPFVMADDNADHIYSLTLNFPDSTEGGTFFYKFQINDAVWESTPDHEFVVVSPSTELLEYFENDTVVTVMSTNFLHITLDMTPYYGSGLGHFDPSTDSIKIEGFWGDGVASELSDASARWCRENVWQPGLFETTIIIVAEEGKNPEFKAHAFPEDHFENWGWETTDNKSFTVIGDSQDIYIQYVPDIVPKLEPLENDLTILFTCDVSHAKNRWLPEVAVDPSTITHVGLKGQNEVLGSWAGSWELSDTTDGNLLMLNDLGTDGDVTAGDNIWSKTVTFPAGNSGGPCLYKYSVYYPGSDTLYSHDNEMSTQDDNHYIFIGSEAPSVMADIFGWPSVNGTPTGIEKTDHVKVADEISLNQNYPNPFNPTTTITFNLPKNDFAKLSVFNILGQKIETLVNQKMNAGSYTVQFDGTQLPTGVYFIRLQAGGQSQNRKMMLLK
ncbi:MAG: T9SS type A sorting domain-containing protein [Candidatus Marinimicrobia bacterium]|nr:T9SS type A sorting domain-containing protein [Candidatus Neomarinimicrobiota bacterium]